MFKITITEEKEVPTTNRGNYQVIAKHFLSAEQMNDIRHRPIGMSEIKPDILQEYRWDEKADTFVREVYGLPPPTESTKTVTTEIYSQTVENLSLPNVIRAVNGLI